jgi:uncharacterized protein YcbX
MRVGELWRYPVKSMKGERLEVAEVSRDGIVGDRIAMVVRGDRIMTSRSHPRLLLHRAVIGPDGAPLVDEQPWTSPQVAQAVREAAGDGAMLVESPLEVRFDVLPLLVATDGAIEALGVDRRRLRPNILIAGVEGLAERTWEGRSIRLGEVVIFAQDLRQRCVMTTYDPDTSVQDLSVLRKIVREFDGTMALNCSVVNPGKLRVGDPVELL